MKLLSIVMLLCSIGLAENKALQPNMDSAPLRIAWADTRVKGSAMLALRPNSVPDLVVVKFKNVSGKDIVKVESEVTLQHKRSGVELVRNYTAVTKKVVLNGKDGSVHYEDMGVVAYL